MKKIVTLYNIENINNLAKYADGFIIGNNDFSTRLTNSFDINDINNIIEISKQIDKEIFLNVNQMFTDQQLEEFKEKLLKINYQDLTGIVVADLGTVVLLKKLGLNNKVIYNPETLLTNIIDFNFLSDDNILGAYIAKEIDIDDIVKIGEKKEYKMFYTGHGHLNMFYSKRHLLDNYQELINKEESYSNLHNLTITEPKRSDSPFPIYQDLAGTHVFRSKVMNSLLFYERLSKVVDYFIIDSIFKDDSYTFDILKLYSNIDNNIDNSESNIEEIKSSYNEIWDNGFLDNKTYYKRKL